MPPTPGKITLMGSGELTATMVEVHKELLNLSAEKARAVFIDTPAGFQLNVAHLSQKAADYFRTRVGHPLSIATLKSAESLEIEACYQLLRQADYILIGPGSPTYALRQWRQTRVPELLTARVQQGGCLVAASAAALTVGRFTLPVYEIYKVGEPPHWVEGLDLLHSFGFELAVMPHWNNAEGGNHDTRFCFMGEPRLRELESQLPPTTGLLGLDEHTALVIDLARRHAQVKGLGQVTLRRAGRQWVFDKHDAVPLALLRGEKDTAAGHAPGVPQRPSPSPSAPALREDAVWDPLARWLEQTQTYTAQNQFEQATQVLLTMERHIWDFREALEERNALGAARDILRDILITWGNLLGERPADRKVCLAPLVEQMLALREQLRRQKQWAAADALRSCLQRAGVQVNDAAEGVGWELARTGNPVGDP